MSDATIRFDPRGAAVWITLDRPDRGNATTPQMMDELAAALAQCAAPEVRAVVLTGAGRMFCAGADLNRPGIDEYGDAGEPRPAEQSVLERHYHPVVRAIRQLAKPVVGAVNGPAVGVGTALALCCDVVYARRSAYFLQPFVKVGLVPDGGASVWVTARVGVARATAMAMTATKVGAEQALTYGMTDEVFDDEVFEHEVEERVTALAAGPTLAYAGVKELMNARVYAGFEQQLLLEAQLQTRLVLTDDFREGVQAFRERRPPEFRGR